MFRVIEGILEENHPIFEYPKKMRVYFLNIVFIFTLVFISADASSMLFSSTNLLVFFLAFGCFCKICEILSIDGTVPMLANVPCEYDTIKVAEPLDFGEISQGLVIQIEKFLKNLSHLALVSPIYEYRNRIILSHSIMLTFVSAELSMFFSVLD